MTGDISAQKDMGRFRTIWKAFVQQIGSEILYEPLKSLIILIGLIFTKDTEHIKKGGQKASAQA